MYELIYHLPYLFAAALVVLIPLTLWLFALLIRNRKGKTGPRFIVPWIVYGGLLTGFGFWFYDFLMVIFR